MAGPKVGCQLIVFRRREEEDLDGVLREVRAAGFDGIERGKLLGGDAAEVKRRLDANGLVQWSLGSPFAALDQIDSALDYIVALGGKYIMVSGVGDHEREGLRAFERAAVRFDAAGRRCQAAGIQLCYHNHSWEFSRYLPSDPLVAVPYGTPGSVTGLERLIELTDPSLVKLCADVYWIQHGGEDPASFLARHRDRIGYPHFKDLRYLGGEPRRRGRLDREEATFVPLGTGEVDFLAIWRVLEPLHLPWVVYEQDRAEEAPGEAAAISRAYLRDVVGFPSR